MKRLAIQKPEKSPTSFLDELQKIGQKSLAAPWDNDTDWDFVLCNDKRFSEEEISVCESIYNRDSGIFIATARNNWDKLIRMNRVLWEALGNTNSIYIKQVVRECERIVNESDSEPRKDCEQ